MLAQHLAQRPVQQVRRRCGCGGSRRDGPVDRGGDFLPGSDLALDHATPRGGAGRARRRRVSTTSADPVSDVIDARVADLSARLGVERRAVEHDADLVVAVLVVEAREHPRLALVLLAAGELGRAELSSSSA